MDKVKRIVKNIPIPCRVIYCVFFAAILFHISFALSADFAEFYRSTLGAFFRAVLAGITSPFPISIAEILIVTLPITVTVLIVYIMKSDGEFESFVRIISGVASVLTLVYSLFTLTFAAGFYTEDIGKSFGIERRDITVDELYSATLRTAEGVNEAYRQLDGRGPEYTTMGMSYSELSEKVLDSFDSLSDEYGFPVTFRSRVKPVVFSVPMTYTHVSGVYTYITGEANMNVNYPDFVIPYTAAHEMSHQRGVSREDEANFVAFLACVESEDPYIRYSGYLNMYQYMASALSSVDPERYAEVFYTLDRGVVNELISYSGFFDRYRDNIAASISDAVNDTYLNIMSGTDSRSYGMVVDLASLYLIDG